MRMCCTNERTVGSAAYFFPAVLALTPLAEVLDGAPLAFLAAWGPFLFSALLTLRATRPAPLYETPETFVMANGVLFIEISFLVLFASTSGPPLGRAAIMLDRLRASSAKAGAMVDGALSGADSDNSSCCIPRTDLSVDLTEGSDSGARVRSCAPRRRSMLDWKSLCNGFACIVDDGE